MKGTIALLGKEKNWIYVTLKRRNALAILMPFFKDAGADIWALHEIGRLDKYVVDDHFVAKGKNLEVFCIFGSKYLNLIALSSEKGARDKFIRSLLKYFKFAKQKE